MLRVVALLALVAAASATIFKPKCPTVVAKYPFDMDKFQGNWILSAGNDASIAIKGKCVKFFFPTFAKNDKEDALKEDQILISRLTGMKDNAEIAYETYFQPIVSDKIGALYSAVRKEGTSMFSPVFKTSVVASDYSSYAVIVSCKSSFDGENKKFARSLTAEIWTREGISLSKDTMAALTNILSSYDIEPASIKSIETKC